jgi:hypothetical protein
MGFTASRYKHVWLQLDLRLSEAILGGKPPLGRNFGESYSLVTKLGLIMRMYAQKREVPQPLESNGNNMLC